MTKPPLVLVDTNVIIEAVRTGCWAAVTGQLQVESVEECRNETLAGSSDATGYVVVGEPDLSRLNQIHAVSDVMRAALVLAYPDADGMDAGERDLFAYAHVMREHPWVVCSPDKASIRAAVALGLGDRVWSLEEVISTVGARAGPPLRRQYTKEWLVSFRTKVILEEP